MLISASLLLTGAAMPLPLAAQAMVQPLPGTTDADKLADLVRELGRNPRHLSALIEAGDLSAKLGDTTAAAALYKRASQIDPNNARVKAGIARILVNGEHPGEALRYFDQAERAGLSPTMFADDRGLAYDLIGEQERAQRDYRLALSRAGQGNEDEVRRRYALSLGISGRKDEALQQIDALLRKSDRGAWRARAFILAMNGDATGANRIATTMMPAGMGTGLAAFFTRLPMLSPADRAFAVHFGEVTPTPQRLADARLVPPLPALGADPYSRPAPVQVAAQTAVVPPTARDRRRGRDARQSAQPRVTTYPQVAQASAPVIAPGATAAPSTIASAQRPLASQSLTASPQVAQAAAPTITNNALQASPPVTGGPVATQATTQFAQAPSGTTTTYPAATSPLPVASSPVAAANLAATARSVQPQPSPAPVELAAARPTTAQPAPAGLAAAAESRTTVPSPAVLAATSPSPAPSAAAQANNLVGAQAMSTTATPAVPQPNAQLAAAPATPPRSESEDSILARIVANISIPAAELGVAPMPNAAPQPGTTTTLEAAAVAAERNAAAVQQRREPAESEQVARPATRSRPTPVETAAAEPVTTPRRRGSATTASKDEAPATKTSRRVATKELAATEDDAVAPPTRRGARMAAKKDAVEPAADTKKLTPKQAAAKAKADAKALADKKAAAEEKKAARTDPERYWIQVAGGATEGDLKKAWSSAKSKSSLLAGRAGYSTPLRATNRVVTGPFKTQAEAQAMVNKLSKQGVSAFTFTSEAGQKMTKLDGK